MSRSFDWLFGKRVKMNSVGAPTATSALRQPSLDILRSSARVVFSHARMESFAAPPVRKTVRLFMNCLGAQDRSGHFATAVAFSLFETLLELAQALLQASIGQQDLDNGSKLAWTATADCN